MGHGANDKLYITHAEHSGALGQHSASSGYRGKQEQAHPASLTPFDCCSITFQPFTHPVCARNEDGTGTVFDLLNVIPWLKKHNNTHPVTGAPLDPSSLITLRYHKNANDAYHDPVTFKTFSEHSHIVAIAKTGNVFLYETINKLSKGRDLVSDEPFSKNDVITLQNPHDIESAKRPLAVAPAPPATNALEKEKTAVASTSASVSTPATTVAAKAAQKSSQPYNISPYASGQTGAAFTSTALDPLTQSDQALFDEEELMFDDISRERKDKDRASRRAYVRVVTNMGGSLNLELFCEKAPKTCYNFLMLARQGKYDNCLFHRLVPGFMIQGGDPTGTGRGGESYWGTPFRDEYDLKGAEKHSERGMLSMANKGMGTNGSQFFFTFRETPHLDGKHTVFGKLVGGEEVLAAMESVPVQPKTEKPVRPIKITEVVIYQDPFDDYKKRLARRLERQAQGSDQKNAKAKPGSQDHTMNWFGEKVGSKDAAAVSAGAGTGVGKYLKRAAPPASSSTSMGDSMEAGKKKRKMGFGNFDNW